MSLPTVLLHDHLDGGLRVETVIDLAGESGHRLPATEPEELARWFDQRESGSLESYLDSFSHSLAVMQSVPALTRVAREGIEDLAADGVVYAELRFAPLLNTAGGLRPEEVVEAVLDGLALGSVARDIEWRLILCAIRAQPGSDRVADVAIRYADDGVAGFDLAGPERGHPPDVHLPAIRRVRELGLGVTLHAGEAAGLDSVARAINRCGADRIGHGVELIHDCRVEDGEIVDVGPVAAMVRDRRIPLEVCPSSNLATKGWPAGQHPIGMLHRAGFQVTLNTDNRLMSRTTMQGEVQLVQEHQGLTLDDVALMTRRALEAAFCDEPLRRWLWEERIAPAYGNAGAPVTPGWSRVGHRSTR